jgi:hypothetical protein
MALTPAQDIEHFHIGNFADKDACVSAMSKASVLVTDKNQSVNCLWVNVNKPVDN